MSSYAQSERQSLVELMRELGPDAPTLCEGWTTEDLAAHLVVRERRPPAALGIVLPPLAARTASAMAAERSRGWDRLLDAIAAGPPGPIRRLDEVANLVEMFVHHEDVRRARWAWQPRLLPPEMESLLWRRLKAMGRLLLRRAGLTVELEAPGSGTLRGGRGDATVRVIGPPDELLLAAFGRLAHTGVELVGEQDAVERLRSAPLGF